MEAQELGQKSQLMNTKRKVLYRYSSAQFDTGSPKSLVAMVDMLRDSAYEPIFLASSEGPLIEELKARNVTVLYDSVESIAVGSPIHAARRICHAASLLRKNQIDVLHMNEFGWNQDIVLAARLLRMPVVLHCRNRTEIRRSNLNRLAASKVLTVSEKMKDSMPGKELIAHKCKALYNSVDTAHFGGASSIREELGYLPTDVVVCTIAQICHRKGTDLLLETAKQLCNEYPSLHFLVVGPVGKGEEAFAKSIQDSAVAAGIADRIRFPGSRCDVADILASVDIFFLPTRAEPFGRVITEAMASRLPVVASRVGGIPEILNTPEIGCLVDPLEPAAFAAALRPLIESSSHRSEMGNRARDSLRQRLDVVAIRKQLIDTYDGLLH